MVNDILFLIGTFFITFVAYKIIFRKPVYNKNIAMVQQPDDNIEAIEVEKMNKREIIKAQIKE